MDDEEQEVELQHFEAFEEVGAQVAGNYLGKRIIDTEETQSGKLLQHFIMGDDGLVYFNAVHRLKLLEFITPGTWVRIRFKGWLKIGGGKRVKDLAVFTKRQTLKDFYAGLISAGVTPQALLPSGHEDAQDAP